MTWKENDTVVHVRDGVCTVKAIEELSLSAEGSCEYLILSPVYDPGSKLYVPTDRANQFLREPITKEEIDELIESIPDIGIDWIKDEKARQRALQEDVKSGSHETLLGVITTLYKKRREIGKSGKKFHTSDEHFLNEAERQINQEFGFVLGIDPSEVPSYIHERLSNE